MTRRSSSRYGLPPWLGLGGASERRRLKRLITFSLLWAAIVIALEVPVKPYGSSATYDLPGMLAIESVQWGASGIVLALLVFLATRGVLRWSRLVVAIVVASVAGGAIICAVTYAWPRWVGADPHEAFVRQSVPLTTLFIYASWITFTYGGFGALVYAVRRRIDQNASALRLAALARERNEAAIAEARLRAMVERIEPRFLLDVMAAARRQYGEDRVRAEQTINACVDFLRTALPQIRSGRSSIATELDVTRAYLQLREHAGLNAQRWRVEPPHATADVAVALAAPIPPLTLLPLLEQLLEAPCELADAGLVVRASLASRRVELQVEASMSVAHGAQHWPVDCLEAIENRLRMSCGADAYVRAETLSPTVRLFGLAVPIDTPHVPPPAAPLVPLEDRP